MGSDKNTLKLKLFVPLMIFFVAAAFLAEASGQKEEIKPKKDRLVILSHKVHQGVAVGTSPEGDVTAPFIKASGLKEIEWRTYGVEELKDKLFREASLPETPVDIGYITNFWSSPRITSLFEPLDDYLKKAPLKDFADFSPSMLQTFTFGGKLYGIPLRVASSLMHANTAIFKERGVPFPPKTMEELFDAAKKLTFTRPNGEKVYGLVVFGTPQMIGDPFIAFARGWPNADFVSPDYKVACTQKPVVLAIEKMKELFDGGAMPPEFLSLSINDMISFFQNGRAAICFGASGYNTVFNDPKQSKVAGNVKSFALPVSKDSPASMKIADGVVNVWAMVIPKGAQDKNLAWDFIRHLSIRDSALQMALNGNGPTLLSVYDDPKYQAGVGPELAQAIKAVLAGGRGAWPGFDNATQSQEIIGNAIHLAILGKKSAQQAMNDAAKELEGLIPK